MLRDLIVHDQKSADATYTANAAMKTGDAVVMDYANKKAKFPTAATAADLYFVEKARIPTGSYTAYTDLSDYHTAYVDVASGEYVVLKSYDFGEVFATDAYTAAGLTASDKGKVVVANTSGKLVPATSTATSKYLFEDFFTDNSHTLARIRVLDEARVNS